MMLTRVSDGLDIDADQAVRQGTRGGQPLLGIVAEDQAKAISHGSNESHPRMRVLDQRQAELDRNGEVAGHGGVGRALRVDEGIPGAGFAGGFIEHGQAGVQVTEPPVLLGDPQAQGCPHPWIRLGLAGGAQHRDRARVIAVE